MSSDITLWSCWQVGYDLSRFMKANLRNIYPLPLWSSRLDLTFPFPAYLLVLPSCARVPLLVLTLPGQTEPQLCLTRVQCSIDQTPPWVEWAIFAALPRGQVSLNEVLSCIWGLWGGLLWTEKTGSSHIMSRETPMCVFSLWDLPFSLLHSLKFLFLWHPHLFLLFFALLHSTCTLSEDWF
jgi:hypothetical protein